MAKYADILLPVAVPRPFTYAIPEAWQGTIESGMLVRVPLGKQKIREGIVWRLHDEAPVTKNPPKELIEAVSAKPIVTEEQMRLWEWIAEYYLCTPGEVMKAALPKEIRQGGYRPPTELYVRIRDSYRTTGQTAELLEQIKRAKTQTKALLAYLALIPSDPEGEPDLTLANRELLWVKRNDITETIPASAILKLIERDVLEQQEKVPARDRTITQEKPAFPVAGQDICASSKQSTLLIHGTLWNTEKTATPLYTDQIKRAINAGKQALILVPDTLANSSLIEAIRLEFGFRCGLYHSRMTDHARSAFYHRMTEEPESIDVVIGTRAALFLPFKQLGLIVVDNEQDGNYKQNDPAPRYNGRDAAVVLGRLHAARTLLVSATPSLESWHNAQSGKYASVTIEDPDYQSPAVKVLERGKGLISKYLYRRIEETIEEGRQVVLFQNRRGFATYLECGNCGSTPLCLHCNATLTYHKELSALQCHYCGWSTRYTPACPSCGMPNLIPRGIGTERIEEEIAELFPQTKASRIDTDIARSGKGAIGRILTDFAEGETGILVGTQMVSRTGGTGEVGLVGVINADNMLSYPDFRSGERAFQLLMQLRGLLPGDGTGEMVVQSYQRTHRVLSAVDRDDLSGFYAQELEEREGLFYPPFVRMVRICFRHPKRQMVTDAADEAYRQLKEHFGKWVSPPFEPQVDRVQNLFILHMLLRMDKAKAGQAKKVLKTITDSIRKRFSTLYLTIEVDPQS